ncbi:MAG: molybdenum ABC transporter ATP-binding protein [Magnetococcales bacterium]|nr:molybdenum ABC transporter ATP-binding protein [Magnetococcales bacterium]
MAPDRIQVCFRLDYSTFSLDVDLDLPGQGVTALFGHSGSGKTTLLRAIAGLIRPAGGVLQVNGTCWQDDARNIFLPTHQRPIGYVFQDPTLFAHLDVRGNVTFGLQRIPKEKQRVSLQHAIELLGIESLLTRKPNTLSGGEKQRVAIARALAVSPAVLLMDEPLAALDLARKQEILPYLERLHHELDIPVLYVSHAPDEVARLADYLVVMKEGRVVANGSLNTVLARIDLPFKMGEESCVVLEAVVEERDLACHLCRADFLGGSLWIRDHGFSIGQAIRVRILARDVSLALEQPKGTSILNLLLGQVTEIGDDIHPGLILVRVQVGDSPVLARVTRRSVNVLELMPGKLVWVQIKSVALME